jgi:hypothetical protein|uniref:Class I SAM-dependent methyltransferase n=1 Tax=Desulfobacca acetoxidans TaxID=60893 RepID=A0A7C3SJ32_9BACT
MPGKKAAISFLRHYGHLSLVSLGCGAKLNRIDNHLRLLTALRLRYYVGIDCVPDIVWSFPELFSNPADMAALLEAYYRGDPQKFQAAIKVFPGTWVEDLEGIHCAVVVCQRVYPDCRWEDIICSMSPLLVLQEDLHGCERQQLRGRGYVRTWSKIRRYGLRPFRPWPIFPGERNLVLWRRQDFEDEGAELNGRRFLRRLAERFIG